MSAGAPARGSTTRRALAWSMCAVTVACAGVTVVLPYGGWGVLAPTALLSLPYAAAGTIVALRRPQHRLGWWLGAVGILAGTGLLTDTWYGTVADPSRIDAVDAVGGIDEWLWLIGPALLFTGVLQRFPTGALPSRSWRPLAVVTPVAIALAALSQTGVLPAVLGVGALAACVLASMASLVGRYRGASAVERAQVRWLGWGAVVGVLGQLSLGAHLATGEPLLRVGALGLLGIPVAMTVAILRHHLFDIDKLVSRTVSYAVVTGALALVYATTTTTAAALLPMGVDQPLVVAGATLAAAGLFRPLRSRIQAVVDRRFDRARYDARLAVDGYRTRLRDAVELDAVAADLLGTVHQTVAPAQASVWLRPTRAEAGA